MKHLSCFLLGVLSALAVHADVTRTGRGGGINPCRHLTDQTEIDECYMRLALDHALIHNPSAPFGAVIVDHTTNEIMCYGVNSDHQNKLLHGETAAFWNCTELYPSPTGDDMNNPGLNWSHQTLYTTGEPCPMCAAQSIYRGVGRVVWGTSIPDLNLSGCQQLLIEMSDVIGSTRLGAYQPDHSVPAVVGGFFKDECDHAFWCAFTRFRDADYYESMARLGFQDYVRDRNERFPCVTLPLLQRQ